MPATSKAVGDAVVSVIRGLALASPSPRVITRKRPGVEQGEPEKLVLVCVGDEEKVETLYRGKTPGTFVYLVTRPVTVAIAMKNGGLVDDNPTLRLWREAIWPAVTRASLAAADGTVKWNDVNPRPEAVFDPRGLPQGYDWSLVDLDISTLEER